MSGDLEISDIWPDRLGDNAVIYYAASIAYFVSEVALGIP